MNQPYIALLQTDLHAHADPKAKAWWENYVKGSPPFIGVKMPVIRRLLQQWHREHVAEALPPAEQFELALALFAGQYTEEKLAGTLFLQEILLPAGAIDPNTAIPRFAALFDEGLIYDWNTCDWFCVKVLGPLIESTRADSANAILGWHKAANLWRARAAVVAFVNLVTSRSYDSRLAAACAVLIQREERFAKTAVGWILREISRHDEAFVRQVLDANLTHFSTESLNNATKYFNQQQAKQYKTKLKQG